MEVEERRDGIKGRKVGMVGEVWYGRKRGMVGEEGMDGREGRDRWKGR